MARGVKATTTTAPIPASPREILSVDGIKIGDERQSLKNPETTGKVTVTGFEATDDSNYGHYVCLQSEAGAFRMSLASFKAAYK